MHLKTLGSADMLLKIESIPVARMSVKTCYYEIRGKFTLKRKKIYDYTKVSQSLSTNTLNF